MRIARDYLIENLTVDSRMNHVEDYIDRYLKAKYAKKLAWVRFAFDLDAAKDVYIDGQKKCRAVQDSVIRRLNTTHDIKGIDSFIDEAVHAVG